MIREFDNGMAVIQDASGDVLRQLVKFSRTKRGHTVFAQPGLALVFAYKKDAVTACRSMHWPQDRIERGENLASSFCFIRYDFRDNYALAVWEV